MTPINYDNEGNGLLPLKELRIDAEIINNLETITFTGEIHLISSESEILDALKILGNRNLVGFDTESRPAFLKGQKFPVSIIQMATSDDAFIFQLKKIGFHPEIRKFLSNPEISKIGVGVHDDIHRLKAMADFEPASFVDLSCLAKSKGLIQTGVRALAARYLGRKLVKSSQKTNWSKTDLSDRQLRYASTDAWICLSLFERIKEDNTDYFELKRMETESECE